MAQVELVIAEDGSATVELSLDSSEAAALIAEAQRASSVSSPPASVGTPADAAPADVGGAVGPSQATAPPPPGPDALTPTGEPAAAQATGADTGVTGQAETGGESTPPAPQI